MVVMFVEMMTMTMVMMMMMLMLVFSVHCLLLLLPLWTRVLDVVALWPSIDAQLASQLLSSLHMHDAWLIYLWKYINN